MRADVWIRDCCRIELASNHKRCAPDSVTFALIICEKVRDGLFGYAMHDLRAPVYLLRIRFELSKGGVVGLARLGNSRVGQVDHPIITQRRRTNWTSKQHSSCPAGFYAKAWSRDFGLHLL